MYDQDQKIDNAKNKKWNQSIENLVIPKYGFENNLEQNLLIKYLLGEERINKTDADKFAELLSNISDGINEATDIEQDSIENLKQLIKSFGNADSSKQYNDKIKKFILSNN